MNDKCINHPGLQEHQPMPEFVFKGFLSSNQFKLDNEDDTFFKKKIFLESLVSWLCLPCFHIKVSNTCKLPAIAKDPHSKF